MASGRTGSCVPGWTTILVVIGGVWSGVLGSLVRQEPNNSVYLAPIGGIYHDYMDSNTKSYARIVVKTTLLVSYPTVPQKEK